jgi:ubiquinone/menaquinone biosynthesis C-methylase UbiE
MRMNNAAAFDVLAPAYDAHFVESLVGHAQRQVSRKWLQPLLGGHPGMQVLEINCGTGADAWWMAGLGHQVTATDASPAMIAQALQKTTGNNGTSPRFATCAFEELHTRFAHRQFDCIVSNFAGLNCAAPDTLRALSRQFNALLRPGGHLAVVVFGKYCAWDVLYYLLKANTQQAFRRFTNKQVQVPLTASVQQPVYYYSPRCFARYMRPLQLVQQKPVGLFIPPSWMKGYMQQHPRLFNRLVQLENNIHPSWSSALADHLFMLFKKEAL